jgi:hypothetical protein
MIRIATLTILCVAAFVASAAAQDSLNGTRNPFGSSPTFGSSGGTDVLRHRGPAGNPCLIVTGYARRHTIDHNLYDHIVSAVNSCAQRITIRACYYQSQDCVSIDIPGNETKEAILGTLPSARDFRFDFTEKF